MMRKAIISFAGLLAFIFLIQACGGGSKDAGQLIGVLDRPKWKGINPFGMVYIPSGTLHVGQSGEDIFNTYVQRPLSISIQGFYMDDTEISNNEYRQFVDWVKEYYAHILMDDFYEDDYGMERIDWELEIDWNDEILDELYIYNDVLGTRNFDVSQLEYEYSCIDLRQAAAGRSGQDIVKSATVNAYPDTLVWVRDFAYSYNDPMTLNYFWHPAFDDYPVVGIDWHQARAFCHWRTVQWNQNRPGETHQEGFRLPNEYEWEYAARGGHDLAPYPWGGYYVRNAKGCLLANFKPGRGNYPEDGGFYTVPIDSYFPNDYGLYNMSGNVSEWTLSAYRDEANAYVHDLNPDVQYDANEDDPPVLKRKVIRGGSWKDIAYYLQTGTRNWEYQDTTKSYIGFRCMISHLGRSANDFR
jgi:sulfatase modifying factor 1